MGIFERYAPFVQDFIYRNRWESLRAIQVAAGDAVFNTDENVLLSASTASGKTEAAFFPILTLFSEDPPRSVGAIYIGPLKALINDQFSRLNDLCAEADHPGLALAWRRGAVAQKQAAQAPLRHPPDHARIARGAAAAQAHGHCPAVRRPALRRHRRGARADAGRPRRPDALPDRAAVQAGGRKPARIGLSATIGDPEGRAASLRRGRAAGP